MKTPTVGTILLLIVSTLLSVILAEAFASVALHSTVAFALLPAHSRERLRYIYIQWTRQIAQYETACTQFDKELFYTLRPGQCRFRNAEFDTIIQVNSAGFRDDEESLNSPEVAVLGDSLAMGWGVNGSETYASLLEKRTGLKVLNTGVSSYGTVREKMTLSRVALGNLKYIVVQYSPDDREENLLFYLRNNTHRSLSQDDFDRVLKWYRDNKRYYPGRNLDLVASHRLFGRLFGVPRPSFFPPVDEWTMTDRQAEKVKLPLTEAELFVNAIVNAGVALPSSLKKIIVFSVDAYGGPNQQMVEGLEAMKAEHRLEGIAAEFVILRTSKFVSSNDYYALDGHFRPSGHAAIADAVAPLLSQP